MNLDETKAKDEAAIRELVDRFVKSIRAKDVDGVMTIFSPDVISFDLGPPLQHGGGAVFTKRWHELFAAYEGPIEYDVRDLKVIIGDDVAFSYSLNRMSGMTKDGHRSDRWLRWSAGYQRIDGRWRIVHEHVSVPVNVKTGQAALDLRP